MTLVASWIGVDSRSPASIYLASDSRISWKNSTVFDHAKKVFACSNFPDIFGYCGDVLFPSLVLNQVCDIIDKGLLFKEEWDCDKKFEAVFSLIRRLFKHYPDNMVDFFQILHCTRDVNKQFLVQKIRWMASNKKWSVEVGNASSYSDKLFVVGSGADEFLKKYKHYWASENKKTSRALFHCFCDTLANVNDKSCGGPPQLAGLYRIGNGRNYGIIYNEKRYFQGTEVDDLINFSNIEWRNELFEVCSGEDMKINKSAQRQPNPLR